MSINDSNVILSAGVGGINSISKVKCPFAISVAGFLSALKEHFPVGTELDVFYNPQNPGKGYVMRYVKNPAVKVLFIIGLAFVILAFIGLAFLPK